MLASTRRALSDRRVADDRHARDAGRLRVADGQRVDVEGAAPEERRHAIQHAWLIYDVYDEGV